MPAAPSGDETQDRSTVPVVIHWLCEEALQYAGPPFDPAQLIDPRGGIRVALFDGLVTAEPDRCT